ncbi:MAG: hypothetical protein ACTSX6_00210 [Candidatus Heimdallarchaeaceae archaeon]
MSYKDLEKIKRIVEYYIVKKKRGRKKKSKESFNPQLKIDWYENGDMYIEWENGPEKV